MIAMLDTSESLDVAENELGAPVEQLLTPLTRFALQKPDTHFAFDNGCFRRFDAASFEALLAREYERRKLCRFVAVPDVVGSALRTLEAFDWWQDRLSCWPRAFVVQDGQEDLRIPWRKIAAIFIGGSTAWKLSIHVERIIKTAQICGKWVHVGRVNTPGRFEYFESLGADSIDGTGLSRYSWMRERIWKEQNVPGLFPKETYGDLQGVHV